MSEPTLDRRHFLKWMGLGTAGLGLSRVMPGIEFWAMDGEKSITSGESM